MVADELCVFDGLTEAVSGSFGLDFEGDFWSRCLLFPRFKGGHVEGSGVATSDGYLELRGLRVKGEFDGFIFRGAFDKFE